MSERWQVLVGIALMVSFEFVNWQMGGPLDRFAFFAMPLVVLAIAYFLVTGELARFERRIGRILNDRLPESRFVNDEGRLRAEMIAAVKGAKEFIMATGGRARDEEYLRTIEEKVLGNEDIEYWRVLLGDHIHHRLHVHLDKVLNRKNVHVRYHEEEIWGNMTITDGQAILALPNPALGAFQSALIVSNPHIVQEYKEFVLKAHGAAQTVGSQFFEALCVECRAEKERASQGNVGGG